MSAQDHASQFLQSADLDRRVTAIAKKLWHAADTEAAVAKRFLAIQDAVGNGKVVVGEKHYEDYRRLKAGVPALDIPTAPEWLRPAIAAAYLRARAAVSSDRTNAVFDNLDHHLATIEGLAKKLEPDFIGELVSQTMTAAHRDPRFAKMLVGAADEVRALVTALYGPDGTNRPAPIANVAGPGGGGGGGDCTACTTVGGQTQCGPVSCWVIVIIIIIIVVAK